MIDGTIARKLGTESKFGSKLDTMAVVELRYSALVVCMVATFAAIQEGHIIRIGKVE